MKKTKHEPQKIKRLSFSPGWRSMMSELWVEIGLPKKDWDSEYRIEIPGLQKNEWLSVSKIDCNTVFEVAPAMSKRLGKHKKLKPLKPKFVCFPEDKKCWTIIMKVDDRPAYAGAKFRVCLHYKKIKGPEIKEPKKDKWKEFCEADLWLYQ